MLARFLAQIGLLVLLWGCAVLPAQRLDDEARELGLYRKVVPGSEFLHVIYVSTPSRFATSLHVYLEGDGSPWVHKRWVSEEPTPRNPLMLRLMALDPGPSVYLGRPCYHGLASQPPCTPEFWTHGRYSHRVVGSMAAALRGVLRRGGYKRLIFIGHSGGGALAMLLAERFAETHTVVTMAGNLDPKAWARHHGYSPLRTSLNPAERPALDPAIFQLHLVGERDENIPAAMLRSALSHQKNARIRIIANFDHVCCWQSAWPSVLQTLSDSDRLPEWGAAKQAVVGSR